MVTNNELMEQLKAAGYIVVLTWTADEFKAYLASYQIPITSEDAATMLQAYTTDVLTAMLVASVKQFNKIMRTEFAEIFKERDEAAEAEEAAKEALKKEQVKKDDSTK